MTISGLTLGLLWWQKEILILNLPSQLNNVTDLIVEPTLQPTNQVALVYSAVITLNSPAFTADFYLDDSSHLQETPWIGLGGRTTVETYTVQAGDTLWGIAYQFELALDTLRWSNRTLAQNPDVLSVGTELIILPVNGVYHTVIQGDTLTAVATQYGVAEVDITNYPLNDLGLPHTLQVGDGLVIPNGHKNKLTIPAPNADLDYPLAWPLIGAITLDYQADHPAVDIGSNYGATVYAAEAGTVSYSQWANSGYGFTIIIEHDQQQQTLYGHLKGSLVQEGDYVQRGQAIGAVGSTGNSTGPHVHFEVRQGEQKLNPLNYLKAR